MEKETKERKGGAEKERERKKKKLKEVASKCIAVPSGGAGGQLTPKFPRFGQNSNISGSDRKIFGQNHNFSGCDIKNLGKVRSLGQ